MEFISPEHYCNEEHGEQIERVKCNCCVLRLVFQNLKDLNYYPWPLADYGFPFPVDMAAFKKAKNIVRPPVAVTKPFSQYYIFSGNVDIIDITAGAYYF